MFFDFEHTAEVYLGSFNHVVMCDWPLRVNDFLFFRVNARLPQSMSFVQPGGNAGYECAETQRVLISRIIFVTSAELAQTSVWNRNCDMDGIPRVG